MATRMQQRRGTASQWISTNDGDGPILNVGEIGFETDTGKFKIGDGQNPWVDLDYFLDESEIQNITGDYVLTSTLGQLNGVATLDGSGKLTSSQIPNIDELSQEAVNSALVAGTGLDKTYDDNANTITIDIDSTVVTLDGSQILTNKTISGTSNSLSNIPNNALDYDSITINGEVVALGGSTTIDALPSQTGQNGKYLTTDGADASWSTIDLSSKQDVVAGVSDSEIGYLSNVTSDIQSQIDSKAPLSSPTFTGTVSGVTASMVGLGNVDNTSDANKPVSTATQSALDAKLALSGGTMTGDITLAGAPTQALHAATKAYVDGIAEGLHIHASCVAATTGNVAIATELEPGDLVDGVTLAEGDRVLVKSQTNAAQNGIYVVQASGAALRAADFNEPQEVDGGDFVFVTGGTTHDNTGWVQTTTNVVTIGTDPIMFTQFSGAGTYLAGTGLQLDDNIFSIDTATTVDTSTAQTLTNKTISAASNTLTIATTDLQDVTASAAEINILDGATLSTTELNYVDGVTSSIQDQIDTKLATSTAASTYAPIASPTFTGTVSGVTKSMVGLANVDNTADVSKPISNATQTALDAKIAKADITAKGAILVGTGSGTYTAQTVGTNGQVLTANSAQADGVEWTTISSYSAPTIGSTSIASGATVTTISGLTLTAPVINLATSAQTASYTLVLADNGKLVEINNASANNLTVPLNSSVAFPIGAQVNILQTGAGQTTVVAASGVTINGTPGLKLRAQWSSATLIKRATDTWVLVGDISA